MLDFFGYTLGELASRTFVGWVSSVAQPVAADFLLFGFPYSSASLDSQHDDVQKGGMISSGGRSSFLLNTGVSRRTLDRLEQYESLLQRWNPKINLVSPSTVADVWGRHFLDSAQLHRYLPAGTETIVDLGSGAGFPGLVLAMMGRAYTVHLVESDQRKAVFLGEVSRMTQISNVNVHVARAEELEPLGADVVTARALAPLEDLLRLAQRHLKPSGVCLFLKGAEAEKEAAQARRTYSFNVDVFPSMTHPRGAVLRLSDIRITA